MLLVTLYEGTVSVGTVWVQAYQSDCQGVEVQTTVCNESGYADLWCGEYRGSMSKIRTWHSASAMRADEVHK